jgi:glutaconyl-CoA/methylmalonyl-CoA decarboxylase subunit gamma
MQYLLKIGETNYPVDIEDITARPVIAIVQGQRFEVWQEKPDNPKPAAASKSNKADSGASQTPCPPPSLSQAVFAPRCVTAPIPGVIVAINVKPGQSVSRGEELCVLEAMKMKNSIRSAREGEIKSIAVIIGEQVSHGQTILEFTD